MSDLALHKKDFWLLFMIATVCTWSFSSLLSCFMFFALAESLCVKNYYSHLFSYLFCSQSVSVLIMIYKEVHLLLCCFAMALLSCNDACVFSYSVFIDDVFLVSLTFAQYCVWLSWLCLAGFPLQFKHFTPLNAIVSIISFNSKKLPQSS